MRRVSDPHGLEHQTVPPIKRRICCVLCMAVRARRARHWSGILNPARDRIGQNDTTQRPELGRHRWLTRIADANAMEEPGLATPRAQISLRAELETKMRRVIHRRPGRLDHRG